MGNSKPPAAVIDLVDSYACRHDGQVQIVLVDPQAPIGEKPVIVMRRGNDRLKAPAQLIEDERGRRLVALVPRGRRLRGTWKLKLVSEGHPRVRLQARLLVQGPHRPVVLLWGHRSDTSRLPEPHPRESEETHDGAPRRLASKAVSMLPEGTADQLRRRFGRSRRGH